MIAISGNGNPFIAHIRGDFQQNTCLNLRCGKKTVHIRQESHSHAQNLTLTPQIPLLWALQGDLFLCQGPGQAFHAS